MSTNHERLEQVCKYAYKFGDAQASEHFDISLETISRYKRTFNQPTPAKILIFDIENAPVEAFVWNTKVWKAFVAHNQIEHDWFMLTWSAKWLNDSEILCDKLTPKEAKKKNDSRLVKNLWSLFDEADIIVAHNAAKFDVPMANTRFILNGLPPVRPYRVIDTLDVAKKNFRFTHNKLDYLGELFGIGHKIDTDFSLWRRCLQGEAEALQEMSDYNKQDVLLLEEVYLKMRGWVKSHPNLNLFVKNEHVCSACGSRNLNQKGEYTTAVNSYISFQCSDCGAFSRMGKNKLQSIAR